MTYSFEGKVAVVTGAGHGLGRSHALELARRGAKVVVNDLGGTVDGTGGSSEAAQSVVKEIQQMGGEAIANGGSVSDPQGAQSMIDDALNKWGQVDILINNAGILRDKSFKNMSLEDFKAVVDVHLMGTAMVTKCVWQHMYERQYGRIVVTTSASGLWGNFGQTNYSAAKLGVVGFMNTLAKEGGKKNIKVNAIAPIAGTRMTEGLMPKQMLDQLKPELVTPGVLYLCTDDAPTGFVLQAGGGRFFRAQMLENQGANIKEPTLESVAEQWDKVSDMSNAKPGRGL